MDTETRAEGLNTGACVQKANDGVQGLWGYFSYGQLKKGFRKVWIPLQKSSRDERRGFYESVSEDSASPHPY